MRRNKKGDILQAAYELFVENGYDNTSMKAIAQRANTLQSHIYNFYESKELVFEDVLHMAQDKFQAKMIDIAREYADRPPEEYIGRCYEVICENRGELGFIVASALTPKLQSRTDPLLKEYSEGMKEMMKPLFPNCSEAQLRDIGSLLLAISDSLLIDGDKERGIRTAEFAIKMFSNYTGLSTSKI